MKISLNWIRDYVALDASVDEVSRAITFLGFEVEGVVKTGAPVLSQVVVGEVLTRDKHPNADKLSVCTVDVGPAGGVKTIVCGAQNYKVGDRVPVALVGAVLPGNFVIKESKIRGQLSYGMMCSGRELGIGEDHSGLLILEGRPAVGTPINDVLPAGDTVIDVEITPNRPDCLSHLGLARELAAWFKKDLAYPQTTYRGELPGASRPDLLAGVRVDDPEGCPLYTAHVITGVKVGPSPSWIQERLKAIGLRPINNIVDVTNYVMLEYGQPLHAFDATRIAGRQIVVRRAGDGEKIVTLDEKERTLSSRMLVIADQEKPLIIAGVMGGLNSGVSESTTDLVLECAIFKARSVRWTSKHLALSSDSSYRYERGVDPHTALEAAYRAIDLILATAGGTLVGPVHRVGGDVPWKREVSVAPGYIRERLGFDIPDEEMRGYLESLELVVTRVDQDASGLPVWTVSIPSWRDDLDRPVDLVEEVLRLYGTEKIPQSVVRSPGFASDDDPVVLFNRKASAYLVGHDFTECVNMTLRPEAELATWISQTAAAELRLANPFVEDQSHLRPSLVAGLLDVLKLNRSRGVAVSRLFEVGRIFVEANGKTWECAAVGLVIVDDGVRRWRQREAPDFYTVKRLMESVAAEAGVDLSKETLVEITGPGSGWQAGHSASAGSIESGWGLRLGLLNLSMARAYGIEGKVYAGVFSIRPEMLGKAKKVARYQPVSLFPAALRDLALVADLGAPAQTVRQSLCDIAARLSAPQVSLEAVELFDLYQGAGIPEGKKSLAFSLVFRSPERTLTDDEVNGVFQKIQDEVCATTPYQIRK